MMNAKSETQEPALRLGFDRRIQLAFHSARTSSDSALLAYREMDDVFGLIDLAATIIALHLVAESAPARAGRALIFDDLGRGAREDRR